jgi:signal transduction histidine kinase
MKNGPAKQRHLSLRAKLLLTFGACILVAVFMIFAGGNYYIDLLQKRNVQLAVELAQEQARKLSRDILELLSSERANSLGAQEVKEKLRPLTQIVLRQNRHILWAGIFDPETGNYVIEQTSEDSQTFVTKSVGDNAYRAELATQGGRAPIEVSVRTTPRASEGQEVRQVIEHNGKRVGEIHLRIAESPGFQKIEATSSQISRALLAECLFLLVFLGAVFWVVWRLVSRHVALVERHAALDRMAYVGTLASGLAHEIRNPLNAMNLNLEVIREELSEASKGEESRPLMLLDRVQKEVAHLNRILTNFLDFALPTRESITRFSLRGLVEELLDVHSTELAQHEIRCELDAPSDTWIEADRRLVYQALRNVLVNAIEAVKGRVQRHITIEIAPHGGEFFRIVVSDTGPGISPENRERIFDVFFSTRKGGTGLGLAITKKIIEEHGGSIRAQEANGGGAQIVIELPRDTLRVLSRNGSH